MDAETRFSRYYHPSNARFWFYGDDDPEERLRILDAYLSEFEAREVDSTVGVQPLFAVPSLSALPSLCRCHLLGVHLVVPLDILAFPKADILVTQRGHTSTNAVTPFLHPPSPVSILLKV